MAVVAPIIVKYDAISSAARDTVRVFSGDPRFVVEHFGCVCHFPDIKHHTCNDVAELLLHPAYQAADVAIFHFGIHHSLFDGLLAGGPRCRIVRFHNVTPAQFVAQEDVAVIERSLRQIDVLREADEIWADSPANEKELLERSFEPSRIHVIPLMVEDPALVSLTAKAWSRVELLYVGRIAPSKGLHDLLDAMTAVSAPPETFRLTIAGNTTWSDPRYLRRLNDIIRASGLPNVEFAATVDDEERDRLLHAAHVMVVPSYHEGFCRPVAEGFRAGCVPLVYDSYNLPYIAGGLGRVVKAGDVAALAAGIDDLVRCLPDAVRDPSSANLPLDQGMMSANDFVRLSRSHIARFTFETVSEQMRTRLWASAAQSLSESFSVRATPIDASSSISPVNRLLCREALPFGRIYPADFHN